MAEHPDAKAAGKHARPWVTRAEAIACAKRALHELRIEGVKTTVPLQLKILDHPAFVHAEVDTTFIERTWL